MQKQGQKETQQQRLPSSSSPNLTTVLLPTSSQYIGNLAINSPLSFRIPLKIVEEPTTAVERQTPSNMLTKNTTAVASPSTTSTDKTRSITMDNNTAPGIYPASLKITYSDDSKNTHELIINKTVSFHSESTTQVGELRQDTSGQQLVQQPLFTNGFIDAYWVANTVTVNVGVA